MQFLNKLDGEIMIELGVKLKLLRKSKGLSQQHLADRVGVSRKLIIDIEAGRGTSLLVFVKILKTFKKTDKLLEILNTSSISPKEMYKKENK
ncbi:MAG: helix-turn-helix transcriptional regulator [Flavobacteriales bacterium]|nr:helix-turn-helix transcriptional regulator [Flavobacteriales bacterium]MCH2216184.1 helix-turn-helix transcriptional regulator [Flavobacteriales bacterium]